MATIDQEGFAEKVRQYMAHPEMYGPEAAGMFVDLSLQENGGISFGGNTKCAMELIRRAYSYLQDGTDISIYSKAVAGAMQHFAEPLLLRSLVWPHFLLHGIERESLDGVINKIQDNSRIIHETIERQFTFSSRNVRDDSSGLFIYFSGGTYEDSFGIASHLMNEDNGFIYHTPPYLAKVSFFLDETNKEVYVITIQGQKPSEHIDEAKKQGREFARVTAKLGMDPRTYLLKHIMDSRRKKGYKKAKVIRPHHHPYWIEQHEGFTGKYEPIILQAGIDQENGCYLEAEL